MTESVKKISSENEGVVENKKRSGSLENQVKVTLVGKGKKKKMWWFPFSSRQDKEKLYSLWELNNTE